MLKKIKIDFFVIHNYLIKINRFKLVFFAVVLNFLFSLIFSYVSDVIFEKKLLYGFKNLGSLYNEFILVILIAPLFETLLFQYGIIEIVRKKFTPLVCCSISALIFALMHTYNLFYFFFAFLGGLLFAYLYFIGKSIINGFLLAFSVHLIYNCIVFLIKNWCKIF